jgi:DNA-binding transcriptional ArsR family regulator
MNEDKCGCRIIHLQAVEEAKATSLSTDEFEKLSQVFKVLADQSRLRILFALQHREMCVCDLAALLEITESAVSHQLRFLRNVNLVKNRRDGTVLYYRLVDDHVKILTDIALTHIKEKRND